MKRRVLFYIIFIIIILLVVDVWALLKVCSEIEHRKPLQQIHEQFIPDSQDVPQMGSPFVNVYDDEGKITNIILVSSPMNRSAIEKWKKYSTKGILFLGITSYMEYPGKISNPFDVFHNPKHETWNFDYTNEFSGWLHTFRKPSDYNIGNRIPKLLLSESDFSDHNLIRPDGGKKIYDFIYVCPKTQRSGGCNPDWTSYNKNWGFALECLDIMCSEFQLKGLLVGRKDCSLPGVCNNNMTTTDFLPWKDMIKAYNQCKFIFVPNIYDASPRVITEAMCCDIPLFVNANIIGGWKYVNSETGMTFNNLDDFKYKLDLFLGRVSGYSPRDFFVSNHGILNSGRELLQFIFSNYKGQTNVSRFAKYLTIRFPKPDFKVEDKPSKTSKNSNIISDVGSEISNIANKTSKYILDFSI